MGVIEISIRTIRSLRSSLKEYRRRIKKEISNLEKKRKELQKQISRIRSQMERPEGKRNLHRLASKLAQAKDNHQAILGTIMLLDSLLKRMERLDEVCDTLEVRLLYMKKRR